jgi:hypothetical protein
VQKDVQNIGTIYAVPNQTGLKHYGTGSLIRLSCEFMYAYHTGTTVRVHFACYRPSEFVKQPLIPAHDCPIIYLFIFESIQYCYIQYVTIVEATLVSSQLSLGRIF